MSTPAALCDASLALAWLLDEPLPAWARSFWADVVDGRVDVLVPTLFWMEIGNILARRRDLADEQVLEGIIRLEELAFRSVEMDRPLRLMAVSLARRFWLTTYDALYLALADAMDAPLATLDEPLGAAAGAIGRRYGHDGTARVGEAPPAYRRDREPDRTSLAALGAYLSRLRAEVAADP